MPSKKRSNGNDEFKFQKDEKVLVLPQKANDDIYEAKVLDRKSDAKSKVAQYKIHYKGWNKRWDEWVDARRLLKINPTNIQIMAEKKAEIKAKQQKLEKISKKNNVSEDDDEYDYENDNNQNDDSDDNYSDEEYINNKHNKKKRKLRNVNNNTNNTNNKKRRLHTNSNTNNTNNANPNNIINNNNNNSNNRVNNKTGQVLEIKLPTNLKRALITDWENITKKNLLIELPRNNGVRITDILNDFENFAIKSGQDKNIVTEISRGLKDYFNQALKVTLLYKLERNQYNNITQKNKHLSMDQIYGIEHLCRLFVKLPQLLSPNDLDNDTKLILKQQIEFIIQFILTNKHKYFNTKYVNARTV